MLETLLTLAAEAPLPAGDEGPIGEMMRTFGIDGPYVLAQIINFVIVALILWFFAFKPVQRTLEDRQKKISDGLQYADDMKAQLADAEQKHAATLKQASQEAQQILKEARANAQALSDRESQAAAARAEDIVKKAQQAARNEREQMMAEVRQEISALVVQTTKKVLQQELSEEQRARFSEAASRELASRN